MMEALNVAGVFKTLPWRMMKPCKFIRNGRNLRQCTMDVSTSYLWLKKKFINGSFSILVDEEIEWSY